MMDLTAGYVKRAACVCMETGSLGRLNGGWSHWEGVWTAGSFSQGRHDGDGDGRLICAAHT